MVRCRWLALGIVALVSWTLYAADPDTPQGFTVLFAGGNLKEWRLPKDGNKHWKIVDGMIDYDAISPAKSEKHLWTKKSYRDFVLKLEWRFKSEKGFTHRVPYVEAGGSIKKDDKGREVYFDLQDDLHGGILLRGKDKNVVNLSKWPVGSGQIGPTVPDRKTPPELRAACTPKEKADNPFGEWNALEITVKGERVNVKINEKEVIIDAPLPDPVKEGPIGLQHSGNLDSKKGRWREAPSLVQFRKIYLRELK